MATYKLNSAFPFHALELNPPYLQNDSYIYNLHLKRAPVYVQFPTAFSRQGIRIIQQKHFLDLKYDTTNMSIIQPWIDILQSRCIELLHSQNMNVFSKELSQTDLMRMMTPVARPYTDDYTLIRVSLDVTHTGDLSCILYDAHRTIIQDYHTITSEHSFIPLLLLEGVTLTPTSFTINIKAIQMMVFEPVSKEIVFLIDPSEPTLPNGSEEEEVPSDEQEEEDVQEEDEQNILKDISLDISDPNVLILQSPKDVYSQRYKEAFLYARKLKKEAMDAHLIALHIKTSYQLEDIEFSEIE